MINFGSLEFMSLGIEYDMVLLPPCSLTNTQDHPGTLLIAGGRDRATAIVPPVAPCVPVPVNLPG
jgi:hypothetical protein